MLTRTRSNSFLVKGALTRAVQFAGRSTGYGDNNDAIRQDTPRMTRAPVVGARRETPPALKSLRRWLAGRASSTLTTHPLSPATVLTFDLPRKMNVGLESPTYVKTTAPSRLAIWDIKQL
jgi:hypothetical protein